MLSSLLGFTLAQGAALPLNPAASHHTPLRVVLKESAPFSFKDASGEWQGISVALWQQIANNLGISYRFEEKTLQDMLSAVENHHADVAIGALTITPARESRIDFSHSFYNTGLGIAVAKKGHPVMATLRQLLTLEFLLAILGLMAVIFIGGFFVWLAERKQNNDFAGKWGLGSGFWWSAVTMTTVGYGDKTPKTFAGRVIGLIWMFLSLVIVSSLVAAISASLTVESLRSSISNKDDLRTAVIATVKGSSSQEYLQTQGLGTVYGYDDLAAALNALADGEVQAVVYDKPLLRYLILQEASLKTKLRVLPLMLERQDYGFALVSASPLREALNLELLYITSSDLWQTILNRYLGSE